MRALILDDSVTPLLNRATAFDGDDGVCRHRGATGIVASVWTKRLDGVMLSILVGKRVCVADLILSAFLCRRSVLTSSTLPGNFIKREIRRARKLPVGSCPDAGYTGRLRG